MLNVSGTMLIVRRREHGTGGPAYIRGKNTNAEEKSDHHGYTQIQGVYIPYGEPCMMLSFAGDKGKISVGGSKIKLLKLLWRNIYVDILLTDKQANAWFTFFPTWNKRGHAERFERFKTDGSLEKLYKICGLNQNGS